LNWEQIVRKPKEIETDVRAASLSQIHVAIDRLHEADFVSAITLGSAAEGILPTTDNPHLFAKLEAWQKSLPADLEGAAGINDFNNWTKHGENNKRPNKAKISELEVITSILRAISKFIAVYNERSPQMKAFSEWAEKYLLSDDKPAKKNKLKARLPRGLTDRSAGEIAATLRITETIRGVFERYGFEPVETPAFEYTDALGKFLPDQDRPNEGVFSFQDDDEQWISLRYDLTAPLARYVAENFDALPKPYRSYRAGYVYRNEKPGPGRYRQFMQFDADTVGSASPAADAEMCMMAADTMEALGIKRGQYVVKVNNRKVLDGVMESIGLGGEEDAGRRLSVLRAIDKSDKFEWTEVEKLLGVGRKDESGDFTKGAELDKDQIEAVYQSLQFKIKFEQLPDGIWRENIQGEFPKKFGQMAGEGLMRLGLSELGEISKLVIAAGYDEDRIRIDSSVVRGLEYYTGPVYEVELLLDTKDEKGRPVRFGSVGGGGRYDGLVSRFRGEPIPATGFSIGVSRLQAALTMLGKLDTKPEFGPVVVTVFDRDRVADYQRMVATLRNSPIDPSRPDGSRIRAELYLGNPKNLGNQLKYADKRNSPCAIIQGPDEKARSEVLIKDCLRGAKVAEIKDRAEYLAAMEKVQYVVPEGKLVEAVREVLARHDVRWT
jgi:histidyl-tRNA synthetase